MNGVKILTPNGFRNFLKIEKKEGECLKIYFSDNKSISCTKDHRFYDDGKPVFASNLRVGQTIQNKSIIKIEDIRYSNRIYSSQC